MINSKLLKFIVEIKITAGNCHQMYEDEKHEVRAPVQ